MEEIVLWRTANLLVTQHGQDAAIKAAQRCEELFARGDTIGADHWRRIIRIIKQLQAEKPDSAVLN